MKELKDYSTKELEEILRAANYTSDTLEHSTIRPKSDTAMRLREALNPSRLPSDRKTYLIYCEAYSNSDMSPDNRSWAKARMAIYLSALENARKHPDLIDEMVEELKERLNGNV